MDPKGKRMSSLNPNAAPFVPSSYGSGVKPSQAANPNTPLVEEIKSQQVPQGTQENTNLPAEYRLPDSISFDYDEGLTDEQQVVENIANMYPAIPWDFIHEFAGAHGFDFDLTVDMLEQFFPQGETSQSQNDVGPDPPNTKPFSSITSDQ